MKQSGRMHAVIIILFFLSGACGLIYEVAWQRMLSLVFGNSNFATATVLASFMCGLALGSFFFGRIADRYAKPLTLYACLEAGIGIFAVIFPLIISGITSVYVGIYQRFQAGVYFLSLLRFILCFLALLIPTFLMGGSLPVISKFFVRRLDSLGRGTGSLYASNTLGGVVGCFSAGFLFIVLLGTRETTYAAAVTNILIAAAALVLGRSFGQDSPPAAEQGAAKAAQMHRQEDGRQAYPGSVFPMVLSVYAFSGFCALAYEVLWARALVFFLSNVTYAFTIMLTTFLFGSALGSMIFARFIDRRKNLLGMLAAVEILIAVFAVFSIWGFGRLNVLMDNVINRLGYGWYGFVAAKYAACFLIMFLPTLLMGIAFPLVSKIYTRSVGSLGRSIGSIYSANTLGCVLGALAAGFIVIPLFGISKGIMFTAALNLTLGVAIIFHDLLLRSKAKYALTVATFFCAGIIAVSLAPASNFEIVLPGEELIYYKEGAATTVAVVQKPDGIKELRVNGIREVPTDYSSLRTFHMLGHLPCLLHERPREALVICFGAGIASGAMTRHPLERIDVVEISPEVVGANGYFIEENQAVLADPRINLIIEDGRNYLLRTENRYDIIASDATHPINSDSYLLFSREFYELCSRKLKDDGIICQWLPLHDLGRGEYRGIIKTFRSVFPDASLWFINDRFTIMLGRKKELKIDFALLTRRLGEERINGKLREFNLADPFTFLACFMLGKERLAEYSSTARINTDNLPFIQFYRKAIGADTRPINLGDLSDYMEDVSPYLTNVGAQADEVREKVKKYFRAEKRTVLGQVFYFKDIPEREIAQYEKALAINPEDGNTRHLLWLARQRLKREYLVRAAALQRSGKPEEAAQLCEKALSIDPRFADALNDLGLAYNSMKDFGRAEDALRRALEIEPDVVYLYNTLGVIHNNMRMDEQAQNDFRRAIELDPGFLLARYNLARLYKSKGMYEEAVTQAKKVVEMYPRYAEGRYFLAMTYVEMGKLQQAEAQLRKVLRTDPSFGPAREVLKKIREKRR